MEKSKKRTLFSKLTLLILLSGAMLFTSCDKTEQNGEVTCPELATTGFYVVNEGQFGKTKGSLTLYNYGDNDIQTSKLEFGNTTCYGTKHGDKLYFVSKQGKRLVVVDESSMTEIASLEDIPDGRAFAVVNNEMGLMTTTNGAYVINLKDYTKRGDMLEKSDGECGSIYVRDNYIFVISQAKGILIYDAKQDFKLVKELGMASVGFAVSKCGSLWAANKTELLRINPVSLTKTRISLPVGVEINNSWGAWNCGSLTASRQENIIYFTKSGEWGGGNEIYRYEIGNEESLLNPFIKSTVEDDAFYGAGINVDPTTGNIVATFKKDGFGDSYKDNRLVIFDHKTGKEIKRINHEGYKFPGTIIFKYGK